VASAVTALSSRARPTVRARGAVPASRRPHLATRHVSPPVVPRDLGPPHPAGAVRWQVFGLVGLALSGRLLAVASRHLWTLIGRPRAPVLSPRTEDVGARRTAVVPTYRCGAVPDSHRVPCSHGDPGKVAVPAAWPTI